MYNIILQIGFKPVTSPDLIFYNGVTSLNGKDTKLQINMKVCAVCVCAHQTCEECLVKQRRSPEILGHNTYVGNPR